MKTYYLLLSLFTTLKATANPIGGPFSPLDSKIGTQAVPAADPPPAPTPLPASTDGVLDDASVINYTPNTCWTAPLSRPAPSASFVKGTCSVCVLQRSAPDGSADYQLWARDNANNAMGNMPATTVWRLDGMTASGENNQSIINMGQSPLQLYALQSSEKPSVSAAYLLWAVAPANPTDPGSWPKLNLPQAMFDPGAPAGSFGDKCTAAGSATNGAVIYATCFFPC